MGLDATVYRNLRNLPDSVRGLSFELEPGTGWPILEEKDDHLLDEFVACHRRLTNMGGAGTVSAELGALGLPENGLLLSRVLYSGTHCGDDVSLSEVPQLQSAIASVNARAEGQVAEFLQNMSELCAAAIEQGNAIVF